MGFTSGSGEVTGTDVVEVTYSTPWINGDSLRIVKEAETTSGYLTPALVRLHKKEPPP